ncbi:MAG: hypothetical protein Q7S55_05320 [Nanoarchaeota archaeon]|nr:hypothetical protein [Nanoarchaeota archaeon]
MKKSINWIIGLLFLVSLYGVLAAESLPIDLAEVNLPDNLLTDALGPILQKISILVGGIFGIYVILTLLQIQRERKKIRLLQDIRNDLDLLTKHFGVKHAHEKKGIFRRIFGFLGHDEEETAKRSKK